jgi:hypothetical protein
VGNPGTDGTFPELRRDKLKRMATGETFRLSPGFSCPATIRSELKLGFANLNQSERALFS